MVKVMTKSPVILSIHAHPDDEASKGAAIVAKYKAESGARAILITATGGEEGEILNPAMDTEEVRENLAAIRLEELATSVKIIGYDRAELLGYRDSGMPESEANHNPACFARVPLDVAALRVAAIIREERPDVLLTYPERQSRYPHPDHLRVYDVSMRAREMASNPALEIEGLSPHLIPKVYFHIFTVERIVALHEKFLQLGLESPFSPDWFESVVPDYVATTKIDITGYHAVRSRSLRAHATQIDPASRNWFGLTDTQSEQAYRSEDLFLAIAPSGYVFDGVETDLFAGLRVG